MANRVSDKDKHEQIGSEKSKRDSSKDSDILISSLKENKPFKSNRRKRSTYKSKELRKPKSRKGNLKLLPQSLHRRTVLSWLIHSGVLSLNEVIQYCSQKNAVVKEGLVTHDGIICLCCNELLSMSKFKIHAGSTTNDPCSNLFMESGKSFISCLLEAWSAEYKARKGTPRTIQYEGIDENDDCCGCCGSEGDLICCDNCTSAFHQACVQILELPEGSWYCPRCTCRICGDVVNVKDTSRPGTLECLLCEHKYHEACLEENDRETERASGTQFCGESCREIHLGLQSRIGIMNHFSDDLCWTLLKRMDGDQEDQSDDSAQQFLAFKAECNSKLAVALPLMEENFVSMVDSRTRINVIPQIVYSWGSQFARLNCSGYYTMVLEKDDTLISVASFRIHGVTVAEVPFVVTCSKYRRQGMCRRLIESLEQMLKTLKVEMLLISAEQSVVGYWTNVLGFAPLEDDEKRSFYRFNLMVFHGSVWLKKHLSEKPLTALGACLEGNPSTEPAQQSGHVNKKARSGGRRPKQYADGKQFSLDK